jgi:uncharacterized repeat protein (TIGR01451 family)
MATPFFDVYISNLRTGFTNPIISESNPVGSAADNNFNVNIGDEMVATMVVTNNTAGVNLELGSISLNFSSSIDYVQMPNTGCFTPTTTLPVVTSLYAPAFTDADVLLYLTVPQAFQYANRYNGLYLAETLSLGSNNAYFAAPTTGAPVGAAYYVLQTRFRILNSALNIAGIVHVFGYDVIYSVSPAIPGTTSTGNATFTILEPALTLTMKPPLLPLLPGGILDYTIRVDSSSTTTNNTTTNNTAYDVVLDLTNVLATGVFSGLATTLPTDWTGNVVLANPSIATGTTASFTVAAQLQTYLPNARLNIAPFIELLWNSSASENQTPTLGFDIAYGRNGSDRGVGINNYFQQLQLTAVRLVPPEVELLVLTPTATTPGAVVNYALVVTVPPTGYGMKTVPSTPSNYQITVALTDTNLTYNDSASLGLTAASGQGLLDFDFNGTAFTIVTPTTTPTTPTTETFVFPQVDSYDGTDGNSFVLYFSYLAGVVGTGTLSAAVTYQPNSSSNQSISSYMTTAYSTNITIAAGTGGGSTLPITLTKEVTNVAAGVVSYEVVVSNNGTTANATQLYLIDVVDGVNSTITNFTQIGTSQYYYQSIAANILLPGTTTSFDFTITYSPSQGTVVVNEAYLSTTNVFVGDVAPPVIANIAPAYAPTTFPSIETGALIPYSIVKNSTTLDPTIVNPTTGDITYTIQVSNNSATANANTLFIIDTPPAGSTITVTNPAQLWVAIPGKPGSYYFKIGQGDLGSGVVLPVTFTVTLPANFVGTAYNTAFLSMDGTDDTLPLPNTVIGYEATEVSVAASGGTTIPYSITKNVVSMSENVVTYLIQVSNSGTTANATDINIIDTLPGNSILTVMTPAQAWISNGTGSYYQTIAAGTLLPGTILPYTLEVTLAAGYDSVAVNTAILSATKFLDGKLPNTLTATVPLTVPQLPIAFIVTKNATTVDLIAGTAGTITYTIQVTNPNPNTNGITLYLIDIPPANVTADAAWTAVTLPTTPTTPAYYQTIAIGDLPVNGTKSYTITLSYAASYTATTALNEAYIGTTMTTLPTLASSNIGFENTTITSVDTSVASPVLYSISKAVTDTNAAVGVAGNIIYTFQITNYQNVSNPESIYILDTLPAGVNFADTSPPWNQVGVSNQYTYEFIANSIPAGGYGLATLTIGVPATDTSSTVINQATVIDNLHTQTPISNIVYDTFTLPTPPGASTLPTIYQVNKAVALADFSSGTTGEITYTITVTNISDAPNTALTLIDLFPAGATIHLTAESVLAGWVEQNIEYGTPPVATSGAGLLIASGDIGAGLTKSYSIQLTVSAITATSLLNQAYVSLNATTGTPLSNVTAESFDVPSSVQYLVEKTLTSIDTTAGTITYAILVTNTTAITNPEIALIDILQTGTTHTATDAWTAGSNGTIYQNLDSSTIPAGQTKSYSLTLTLPAGYPGTTIYNTAYVAVLNTDPTTAALSNVASLGTLIPTAAALPPPAVLAVTKGVKSYDPVLNILTYQIQVSNNSITASPSTGVIVTDVLPAGVTIITGDGWMQVGSTNTYTQTIGTVSVNQPLLLPLHVTVTDPTSGVPIINQVSVSVNGLVVSTDYSDFSIPGSGGSVTPAHLLLTKDVSNYVMTSNGVRIVMFAITVANFGGTVSNSVTLYDTVPAGVTASGNWSGSTGVITQEIGQIQPGESVVADITFVLDPTYTLPTVLNTVYIMEGEIRGPSTQAIFTLPISSRNCTGTGDLIPGCC